MIDHISVTKSWIQHVVIGLNLCPFAAQPFDNNKIEYSVNEEDDLIPVINDVEERSFSLSQSNTVETSFLILPQIDMDFEDFYFFVLELQAILEKKGIVDIALVAFHPSFRYADSEPEDTVNATNRSPYTMIHLLKKDSLDEVLETDVDVGQISQDNKTLLRTMSWEAIRRLYVK